MEHYSKIYSTDKSRYRYNYDVGKLERVANKVQVITANKRRTPVVELSVTDCIGLNQAKFESCPEYWVDLYESVLERTVKR